MASKSVTTPAPERKEAITEWIDDTMWEQLGSHLPMGVWRRLATVNRSLYAANSIHRLLLQDALGKSDKAENDDVEFEGLPPDAVEGLRVAAIELGARAESALDEVKENRFQCVHPEG